MVNLICDFFEDMEKSKWLSDLDYELGRRKLLIF